MLNENISDNNIPVIYRYKCQQRKTFSGNLGTGNLPVDAPGTVNCHFHRYSAGKFISTVRTEFSTSTHSNFEPRYSLDSVAIWERFRTPENALGFPEPTQLKHFQNSDTFPAPELPQSHYSPLQLCRRRRFSPYPKHLRYNPGKLRVQEGPLPAHRSPLTAQASPFRHNS